MKCIAAVGITNQRETTLVRVKKTGQPYHNTIAWQDTRTDNICNDLAAEGGQDRLRKQTRLPLATYFIGPKIKWVLDNVEGLRAAFAAGLAVGFWKNTDEMRQNWGVDKTWTPAQDDTPRTKNYRLWKKAVTRTFDWAE